MAGHTRWICANGLLRQSRLKGFRGVQPAARFGVSYSAAIEWLKRVEETGSVAARSDRRLPAEEDDRALGATGWSSAAGTKDFTLRGLVAELAERGLKVDYRSVWEFVHAEKLSHKKRR